MKKIRRAEPVDFAKFSEVGFDEIKYGLPPEVEFCDRCVISNQRPSSVVEFKNLPSDKKITINFNRDRVCDACKVAEQKNDDIDWEEREERLIEVCRQHRSKQGNYDCIVPGSGGKDSFYASHILKYKYGMNPLTVTWAPHVYTDWGWRNFQRWIGAGFDNILETPNGRVHRLLTRLATEILFHPFQPFILGQKSIAAKASITHGIPLVFYGENEAEYGNPIQTSETAKRDGSFFSISDKEEMIISGVKESDLVSRFGLSVGDLNPYRPAPVDSLSRVGTEVHYLGYYLKWHPQSCYYYSVEHGGFEPSPERTAGTYSKYNSIDDKIDDLHYFTTFIKFGIGRATYDAAQEIRSKDITREEGVALVKKFDGEFPERFFKEVLKYLSIPETEFPIAREMFEEPVMTRDYFDSLTDSFRSPHLWCYDGNGWQLRHVVWA